MEVEWGHHCCAWFSVSERGLLKGDSAADYTSDLEALLTREANSRLLELKTNIQGYRISSAVSENSIHGLIFVPHHMFTGVAFLLDHILAVFSNQRTKDSKTSIFRGLFCSTTLGMNPSHEYFEYFFSIFFIKKIVRK